MVSTFFITSVKFGSIIPELKTKHNFGYKPKQASFVLYEKTNAVHSHVNDWGRYKVDLENQHCLSSIIQKSTLCFLHSWKVNFFLDSAKTRPSCLSV